MSLFFNNTFFRSSLFLGFSLRRQTKWWAAVDFNGFTSMLFRIPVLSELLAFAYLVGAATEKESRISQFPKRVSQITCLLLAVFYLSGFFPSLQKVTELPIKIISRLSKTCTGKTPEQWEASAE